MSRFQHLFHFRVVVFCCHFNFSLNKPRKCQNIIMELLHGHVANKLLVTANKSQPLYCFILSDCFYIFVFQRNYFPACPSAKISDVFCLTKKKRKNILFLKCIFWFSAGALFIKRCFFSWILHLYRSNSRSGLTGRQARVNQAGWPPPPTRSPPSVTATTEIVLA